MHPHPSVLPSFSGALCASAGKPPTFALLVVGALRTFHDPRVFTSIRSNVIDALGAPSVVFIYGKLDSGVAMTTLRSRFKVHTRQGLPPEERLRRLHAAAAYLSRSGGAEVVVKFVNQSDLAESPVNLRCPSFNYSNTPIAGHLAAVMQANCAGSLQSHAAGYAEMVAYERDKGVKFDWVAKLRPDGMWLSSVRPWCTYNPHAGYLIFPQPTDWFFMVPRRAAHTMLVEPWTRYRKCTRKEDMAELEAPCCGGSSPNSVVVGAMHLTRLPTIGFLIDLGRSSPARGGEHVWPRPWSDVRYPVAGSALVPWIFNMVVLREGTSNDFCNGKLLMPNAVDGHPQRPWYLEKRLTEDWGWSYFYSMSNCQRLLDREVAAWPNAEGDAPPAEGRP